MSAAKGFDRLLENLRSNPIEGIPENGSRRTRNYIQFGYRFDGWLHYEILDGREGGKLSDDMGNRLYQPDVAYVELHFERHTRSSRLMDKRLEFFTTRIKNVSGPYRFIPEWVNDVGLGFSLRYVRPGNKLEGVPCSENENVEKAREELVADLKEFMEKMNPVLDKLTAEFDSEVKTMVEIDEYCEQLTGAKQIVFTGAPGTGKTYLARQIAQKMILGRVVEDERKLSDEDKLKLKDQLGFVQFHPSYDYTDFIEGLRPIKSEDGTMPGFRREDGAFKRLCKKALREDSEGGTDNFEEAWNALVAKIDESEEGRIEIPYLKKKDATFPVEMNVNRDGLANRMYDQKEPDGYVHGRSKFFNKEQLQRIYRGLPGTPKRGFDNYRRAIIAYMEQSCGLKPYRPGREKAEADRRKYVMIIDEINRGDIAKIFGELFFAMDKGYRGKKELALQTQYQNLVEDGDAFENGFYVPDNVYIIGTMNDIDRNVESMDFAIRRRFTWIEIEPNERLTAMLADLKDVNVGEAKRRMKNLNAAIADPKNGLGSAYQIGPAYFRELDNYKSEHDGGFELLWKKHLLPLIREYLRGVPNAKKTEEVFEAAYNKAKDEQPEETGDAAQ